MASKWHQVSLTTLELRGLLVRLTGGDTTTDAALDLAAEHGIEKLFRSESGMDPSWRRGAKPGQRRGRTMGALWNKPR